VTGTRDITTATKDAASADAIQPILMAKLEFDGGDVTAHSGLGSIAFNGDTYLGVGRFAGIGTATETSDLSNAPISISLSGIPNDIVAVLLAEQYQGRRATIYLAYLDLTTYSLIADPCIIYRGLIDTADIDQGATFSVSLSIGNRFAAWQAPVIRRYNNADQQARYPGDKGLRFVEQAAERSVTWGGKA